MKHSTKYHLLNIGMTIALLIYSSHSIAAESNWVKYWTENDGMISYFDKNTPFKNSNDGVSIRIMDDLKSPFTLPDGGGKVSSTSYITYINCKESTYTMSKIIGYTGHLATGRIIVKDSGATKTDSISTNDAFNVFLTTLCLKK